SCERPGTRSLGRERSLDERGCGQREEARMQDGMIGLGRMGANMVRRLMRGGHRCVVHDVSKEAVQALVGEGALGAVSLDDFMTRLAPPRIVWLMAPAAVLDRSLDRLSPRAATLGPGAGSVVPSPGGAERAGTAEQGYLHCGPNGAGHFVKMVHNGIEYGLMAAYAEGLNILRHANVGLRARAADAETTPLR